MNRVVLDASVLAKAFAAESERHADQAIALLDSWEAGAVEFVAPELLMLEVMNVAARKWHLDEPVLHVLAQAIDELAIDIRRVDPSKLAHWSAQELTAYDAAYVAVAESAGVPLITDDEQVLRIARDVAVPLATFTP